MEWVEQKRKNHICTNSCKCPLHGIQMFYSPYYGEHGCQDGSCKYASGFESVYMREMRELETQGM